MTAEQLWNDRTFFTLLTDVWKARKDVQLGPMRLGVMLDYVGKLNGKIVSELPKNLVNTESKAIATSPETLPLGYDPFDNEPLHTPTDLNPVQLQAGMVKELTQQLEALESKGANQGVIFLDENFDMSSLPDLMKKTGKSWTSAGDTPAQPIQVGSNTVGSRGQVIDQKVFKWRLTVAKG